MKKEKLSIKYRFLTSLVAVVCVFFGLMLWDYFAEEPYNYRIYIFVAIGVGIINFYLHRYKVTKE